MTAFERAQFIRQLEGCGSRLHEIRHAGPWLCDRKPELHQVALRLSVLVATIESVWNRDRRRARRIAARLRRSAKRQRRYNDAHGLD